MQTRIHILFVTIGFIFIAGFGVAQDFHLSQYDANPLYLNPALTGQRMNEDWDIRANANYREQWNKLMGGPYATVSAGFDMPLNKKFSIGQFVIDNKGVSGSFNTFNLMVAGAYKITHADENHHHNLSVGLQMGFLQKSFNPGNFVFDAQYSSSAPSGFDEDLPSGEKFRKLSFFNFDANMGMYYRFIDKDKKYSPFAGFSIYHLNQPKDAVIGSKSTTPARFTLHGGCDFTIRNDFRIQPQVLYMNQANASELNTGILGFYKLPASNYEPMLGFAWRQNDAIVLHLGLKQKNYFFRMSYDVTTS